MIKLDVQEYCHGCANFTADVKEPEKIMPASILSK